MRKIGEMLGLEWLATHLPQAITGRSRLNLRLVDGITHISDGQAELATTSPERIRYYRHGIAERLRRLTHSYHLGDVALRPGDLVVNVGANIGELAMALTQQGAQVVAVEPDPLTLRCLRLNLAGAAVEIVPAGLWSMDGELTFYQAPQSADTSAINEVGAPTVLTVHKLDTLMAGRDGRVRLLVGDAEGGEPEVLEGARETLRRTDFVALDAGYERKGERTVETCTRLLEAAGFEIVTVDKYSRMLARNRTA
jgi:FkbM family methyltransferase